MPTRQFWRGDGEVGKTCFIRYRGVRESDGQALMEAFSGASSGTPEFHPEGLEVIDPVEGRAIAEKDSLVGNTLTPAHS